MPFPDALDPPAEVIFEVVPDPERDMRMALDVAQTEQYECPRRTERGLCAVPEHKNHFARRRITSELPLELRGMEESLAYEIIVDGETFSYPQDVCDWRPLGYLSHEQRHRGHLIARCDGEKYLEEGVAHDVFVRATLLNTELFWESDVERIRLRCRRRLHSSSRGCTAARAPAVGGEWALFLLLLGMCRRLSR